MCIVTKQTVLLGPLVPLTKLTSDLPVTNAMNTMMKPKKRGCLSMLEKTPATNSLLGLLQQADEEPISRKRARRSAETPAFEVAELFSSLLGDNEVAFPTIDWSLDEDKTSVIPTKPTRMSPPRLGGLVRSKAFSLPSRLH